MSVCVFLQLFEVEHELIIVALLDGVECLSRKLRNTAVQFHLYITLLNLYLCHKPHIHDDYRNQHRNEKDEYAYINIRLAIF